MVKVDRSYLCWFTKPPDSNATDFYATCSYTRIEEKILNSKMETKAKGRNTKRCVKELEWRARSREGRKRKLGHVSCQMTREERKIVVCVSVA